MSYLDQLTKHPYYSKMVGKLSESDKKIIEEFILSNNSLDRNQFEHLANRYFIDKPKPKNWKLISELLSVINSNR